MKASEVVVLFGWLRMLSRVGLSEKKKKKEHYFLKIFKVNSLASTLVLKCT